MNYAAFWRLTPAQNGRQVWHFEPPEPFDKFTDEDWKSQRGQEFLAAMANEFLYQKTTNVNSADLIYRQQKLSECDFSTPKVANDPLAKAVKFYQQLQSPAGYWPGDYGGPLFLAPGLIITAYVTQTPLPAPQQILIRQYMLNHQNADGGWGLHIEGPSTMFGTVLQYVSLRILGMKADAGEMQRSRQWIKANGGATAVPLWGKFYLALLGVYEWLGINSLMPELLILPESLPMHPGNYWCHARMVYLPMAYCYAHKIKAAPAALTDQLKDELYLGPYEAVDWTLARNNCAATDLYYPQSGMLKLFNKVLNVYEKSPLKTLRKKALDFALAYINAEDEQTNFIDIGPVNHVMNTVCIWHAYGAHDIRFKKHIERWYDYLWLAEDGMKMNGYNGSQSWDTAFATQAILEGGGESKYLQAIERANDFIVHAQVREEVRDHHRFYRHNSVGGWPFSTNEHGWPITDCTAEGLKTALLIRQLNLFKKEVQVSDVMLQKAAELILSFQNKNGGWASYELTRGPKWLEALNPSEIFGNIMVDYAYTECSSACVQALLKYREVFPEIRANQIETAIERGIDFILSQHREDGSWYGSWAVCFTYGTWFGVEAITQALKSGIGFKQQARMKEALQKAAVFLQSKQRTDGGWGESFESCIEKKYVEHKISQVVNTSWALLSLMALDADRNIIDKGIQFLISRQQENGDFPQEGISGVFNHNCAITYTAYRNVFPIWALGRYKTKYGVGW